MIIDIKYLIVYVSINTIIVVSWNSSARETTDSCGVCSWI